MFNKEAEAKMQESLGVLTHADANGKAITRMLAALVILMDEMNARLEQIENAITQA